jgi:hypothetical protein
VKLLSQTTPEAFDIRRRVRQEISIRIQRINLEFFTDPDLGKLGS